MNPDGSMPAEQRGTFHICQPDLQDLVLSARLSRSARALVIRSAERWDMSRLMLAECKAIDRAIAEAA